MREKNIKKITLACIKANDTDKNFSNFEGDFTQLRPIQFSDVCLAYHKLTEDKTTAEAKQDIWSMYCEWDMTKTLDEQSDFALSQIVNYGNVLVKGSNN